MYLTKRQKKSFDHKLRSTNLKMQSTLSEVKQNDEFRSILKKLEPNYVLGH